MAQLTDTIANAIQAAALLTPEAERRDLDRSAPLSTLFQWRRTANAKLGAMGFLTGLLGGLWAVAGDAGETAVVMSQARRACHGIGHILGREVDYDADMSLILAVWAGAAEPARALGGGEVAVATGGRIAITGDVAGNLLAKSALHARGTAFGRHVARKAAARIVAQRTASQPAKWMPMMAAMASSAVNAWVLEGLMDAAEKVYSSEYVVLHGELSATLEAARHAAADARAA